MRIAMFVGCLILTGVLVLPATANGSNSKNPPFQLGDRLPPLRVSQVFQGFPEKIVEWSTLKGKAIVLEFWATWCVPCVNQIPHLNKLAEDLSSEPVIFISVALDDEPERVSEFLKARRIAGWVGLGRPELREEFAVVDYPQTYILDRDGRLAAITLPDFLSVEMLKRVLAGQPAEARAKDISKPDLDCDKTGARSADTVSRDDAILVEHTTRQNCDISLPNQSGDFIADGCDASILIPLAYQTNSINVIFRGGTIDARLRVAVRIPRASAAQVFAAAQNAISSALGIHAKWETQDREVYVLQRSVKAGPMLKPSNAAQYSGLLGTADGIEVRGDLELQGLCRDLIEPKLKMVVVNEAYNAGAYDWRVRRDTEFTAVVERDLGLKLVRGVRPVRMLVVETEQPLKQ